MIRSFRTPRSAALLALATLLTGCQKAAPPAPVPARVEAPGLGLVIPALPGGIRFEAIEGGALRFASEGASGTGRLSVTVDETKRSVIVVEEAKQAQKELEAKPEAVFAGGNELVTPAGAGYAVRGSWMEGGARVEERRIFALHPDGSGRLVTLVDRYPAGDAVNARDRLGRELELLAALEAAPGASPP